jgi:serine/threonine-protein kinase
VATSIGRYEIRKELGRGGMAVVYLAADTVMERQVALKLMLSQFTADPQFIARFRREAKTVAQLEHRGITPVYDHGVHQGRPYLVMRYMPGGSLSDLLQDGPLDPQKIAKLVGELAPPLDFAHQKGIIHRDLKPDNILFDEYGSPYLSDFGIVKMIEGSAPTLTLTGRILGTPAYMSPEQARGNVKLDGRSDVYTLGVILFEMLVGKRPYKADTPMGLAMMHVLDPIPNLQDFTENTSPQFQALIDKAMAKNRDERFQTAGELAAALRATVTGGPQPGKPLATAAVASAMAATSGLSGPTGATGQTGAVSPTGSAAQVATSQTGTLPAEKEKRRVPLWLLAVIGIALIACLGIAAAAGAMVLGGDATPSSTPTITRSAMPTNTPTQSRPGAADDGLDTPTPSRTATPTRTPTPTRQPTRTPVNTPTLKPLGPTGTPASSSSTSIPPTATATFVPPTATPQQSSPPTNTPRPQSPTNTPRPQSPTNTPVPPTSTLPPPPPTNTPVPPTKTPVPPTNTPVPPTSTPQPPTNTPPAPPPPTNTPSFTPMPSD